MNTLELRARDFFLRCRAQSRCVIPVKRHADHSNLNIRRAFATTSSIRDAQQPKPKPYYVTTPIFYVNAEPHVGHLYTVILTDVLKRWQLLRGDSNAGLLTGTDEHGMKIQKAAEKAGVPTKSFCDKHAQQFRNLAERANISFDRFIRTTDEDHKKAVEHFWRELKRRGYVYDAKHEGWYSVSDETFYPESQVHKVHDPSTGRQIHASIETGKEVEWTSELNYHFRLSAFQDELLQHYRDHPQFVVPEQRMNFVVKEVESGLRDLSISRPSSRLQWGIRVPDDDSQTIYVWLDALINYLSATGYPAKGDSATQAMAGRSLWPANVHVIGKDIVRFHCIYWPAFLMALDLPLPKAFLTHAHWTLGSAKMSKSLGNGIDPFVAMEQYGLDTIRYYMTHDGGIVDDAAYDNSYIVEKYKKGLQGGLGNLLSRILRARKWTAQAAIEAAERGDLEALSPDARAHVDLMNTIAKDADESMNQLNPRQALQTIMKLVYTTNAFIQEAAPWDAAKGSTLESKTRLNEIIFVCAESARMSCILLQPFMPDKMNDALDMLGVQPSKRNFPDAKYQLDTTYRPTTTPALKGENLASGTLFPPIDLPSSEVRRTRSGDMSL